MPRKSTPRLVPVVKPKDREAESIEKAHDLIHERLLDIVGSMIDLAVGVKVRDPENGEVYVEPGNVKAGQYLMATVMGTPVARTQDLTKERTLDKFEDLVKRWTEEREQLKGQNQYLAPPLPEATVEVEFKELPIEAEVEDSDRQAALRALGL